MLKVKLENFNYHRLLKDNVSSNDLIEYKNEFDYSFVISYNNFIDEEIAVLFNGNIDSAINVDMPEGKWKLILNENSFDINGIDTIEGQINIDQRSGMILVKI